jgi:hypothetical protein
MVSDIFHFVGAKVSSLIPCFFDAWRKTSIRRKIGGYVRREADEEI